jgi:hypothetical protein
VSEALDTDPSILRGELVPPLADLESTLVMPIPSALLRVLAVVVLCPELKMHRIDAERVIALVAYNLAFRNLAFRQGVYDAMQAPALAAIVDLRISILGIVRTVGTVPLPTAVRQDVCS